MLGQYLDLTAKGKTLELKDLEKMSYYKTGLAIEATLVPIAILAKQSQHVIDNMVEFAKSLGIMFQIRDDILDVIGNKTVLGKNTQIDSKNHCSTYVQLCGLEGAQQLQKKYKEESLKYLKELPFKSQCFEDIVEMLDKRES